ncbi:Uncharacterised protein [Mycobacteroides abscessus subsp. abscessus]|nr:Uncharacterised protein [Mycobacteroides abscessus subsp. abscessus]
MGLDDRVHADLDRLGEQAQQEAGHQQRHPLEDGARQDLDDAAGHQQHQDGPADADPVGDRGHQRCGQDESDAGGRPPQGDVGQGRIGVRDGVERVAVAQDHADAHQPEGEALQEDHQQAQRRGSLIVEVRQAFLHADDHLAGADLVVDRLGAQFVLLESHRQGHGAREEQEGAAEDQRVGLVDLEPVW